MNLILIHPSDLTNNDNTAVISGRRFQHISDIHKAETGQTLKAGLLNGNKGQALVTQITNHSITLDLSLDTPPPQALPLKLLLALPRPKMLKRTLQTISAMGVKEIYLLNSYRVDKSYWGSPVIQNQIEEQLILGLEQAGDTILPELHLRKRFKPFIEDELPEIAKDSRKLIAHPYNAAPCPTAEAAQTTLAIGPEGGFIPYEVEKMAEAGFQPIHIGERILRVENAVPALLSRLFPL